MSSAKSLIVVGLMMSACASAHAGGVSATIETATADRVSPRIYVMHGPRGLPNKTNAGFMSNSVFVVTDNGVVVIDPGSSVQIATRLVKAINEVTDHPVVAVFNTHAHGDHWLGNDGIRRAYPDAVIYAHRNMVARQDSGEGAEWIDVFNRMTDGATADTRVVWPEVSVTGGQVLTIGGVQFRIHEPGKAHSDTDIMIEVVNEKVIILGDIVVHRSLPAVRPQDASLLGYMNAFRKVLDLPVKTFVPGHGPTGDRNLVLDQLRLMEKVFEAVIRHYRQGESDFEMTEPISRELAEYRNWNYFDGLARLISYAYLEVEANEFK